MLSFLAINAFAQIGGMTAANGPFTLDNVEDLDTIAGGVLRAWIPDLEAEESQGLTTQTLSNSGLTLAAGQSPIGALRYDIPTKFQYVDSSFGVPMPAIAGASTLVSPGDISSFTHITFLTRASTTLSNQVYQVVLECYPETSPGIYPRLFYNYTLTPGTTFQSRSLDLRSPSLVVNQGTNSVPDLLSKTRFLSFYYYGGPELIATTLSVHVDDIRLEGSAASAEHWTLFE